MTRITIYFAAAAITMPLAGLPAHGENLVAAQRGILWVLGRGGGALVCPTIDSARLAVSLMEEDNRQQVITRTLGAAAIEMHGAARRFDPASLGCVVVPPGTPLEHDTSRYFFFVRGVLCAAAIWVNVAVGAPCCTPAGRGIATTIKEMGPVVATPRALFG